ncbi:helix-turn-helix domain-containing protein [Aliiroseovarius marinus]|uniref:helix-turn-helix domain-containing protein n=1 Tax=Aliiroseovarius marinus TaxID=2500159 RepID=UPI0010612B93|nr:helix-turn-helix domain-containing protein [Aliiroseovarius marinus]
MAHSHEPVAEGYLTIPKAADRLGIPTSTLRRAVNKGLVPFHRPFSQRIRVRLTEVVAAIEAKGEK